MSSQADSARAARSGEGRSGYELFWNKVIQAARDEDFVAVCLLAVILLLMSLYLALLVDIPEVESLLQMPL